MSCTNCNEQPYNKCNPQPCAEQDCSCPTIIKSDCWTYSGDDLACSGIVSGTIGTELIQQFDAFICEKIEDMINAFTLRNIGVGSDVYKGTDLLGRKEIRRINAVGDLVTVTQNTNDISVSIDEEALTDFMQTNQLTYTVDNVGTGAEMYITPQDPPTLNNTEFKFRTLSSETLEIEISLDGETITINTPEDLSIKQFYVNQNYIGIETGSILKPYSKLTSALVASIGTGTIASPEFEGANIIVQSDVVVTQSDLTAAPVLQNKLTVNTINIKSEDNTIKVINFQGTTDYPIDTDFMVNQVGVDGSLNLNRNIYLSFDKISISSETVKGLIKSNSYSNGTVDVSKPGVSLSFKNGNVIALYNPLGAYVNAKTSTLENITLFGGDILVQDSIVNDTPHVYAYGLGVNGEGNLVLDGTTIVGTSQTHFKLLNTTLSAENLNVTTNSYRMPTTDASVVTGIYLPKTDVYKIDVENSYCRITNYSEITTYASNSVDGNVGVGGTNSQFRCTKTNPLAPFHTLYIDGGFIYNAVNNYLLQTDKDFDSLFLVNCNFIAHNALLSSFNLIGSPSGTEFINIEGSSIGNIDSVGTTNITPTATSANVNSYPFSSTGSFIDDAAALSAGLIVGNIYYNTTNNSLKKII